MRTKEDLKALCDWMENEAGVSFPSVHDGSILGAARRRAAALGIPTSSYPRRLSSSPEEARRFLDEVTIGETYFFREERQFLLLMSTIFPPLIYGGRDILIWSAGASTGEEAVSLACALEESQRRLGRPCAYRVLATDLSAAALTALESGRYGPSSFRRDGKALQGLLRLHEEGVNSWLLDQDILSRIDSRPLNLLKDPLPEHESVDIIFLRNTLIYMKPPMKTAVLDRIVPCLKPGGFLFVSSTETTFVSHPLLERREREGVFHFERIGERPVGGAIMPTELRPPLKTARVERRAAPRPRSSHVPRPVSDSVVDAIIRQAARMAAPPSMPGSEPSPVAQINPEESLENRAAVLLLRVTEELAAGDADAAAYQVGALEDLIHENALTLHLEGACERARGRDDQALSKWTRSLSCDPGFWPSAFLAAFTLSQSAPRRALSLLAECLAAMDNRSDGDGHYSVLLNGFDRSYFRMMAQRLHERLDGRD